MPTVNINEVLKDYDILFGGLGPTMEVMDFNDEEITIFNKNFDDFKTVLSRISPIIANDFAAQKDVFLTFAKVFKAKVDGKSFGGISPTSGQFGMQLIIPQDIKYTATPSASEPAYTDYNDNSWTIDLTAGTAAYLLGSSTDFYKASPTVGSRAMLVIMKNGLIEVGTTPKINQIQVQTEKVNYPPFNIHPLADQTIERDRQIYQYNLPFAIPVFYDFGIKMSVMPTVTGTSDLRLIGLVFYEHDFKSSLKYIS